MLAYSIEKRNRKLSWLLQFIGFATALGLSVFAYLGLRQLIYFASDSTLMSESPPVGTALLWAATGGFFGGAGRAAFMFIYEVGNPRSEFPPEFYLQRWFLYLFKPVMGAIGGVFFFLAVNFGLIKILGGGNNALDFPHVCLTAVLGGVFFESAIASLERAMPRQNTNSSEGKY